MDRVRRRIQSSQETVVELFQGYVADLHASYFAPRSITTPPPPRYLHLNEIVRWFYWTMPLFVVLR